MRCGSPTCLTLLSTLRQPQSSRTIALAGGASLGITYRAAAAGVCFRSRRDKEKALVQEAVEAVGTFPSSASSPWGLCSPALSQAPGQCPSRYTVSLISQAQVLSCVPVQCGRGLGTPKLKAQKYPRGRAEPQRVAGQGMRVTAHRGPCSSTGRRAVMP